MTLDKAHERIAMHGTGEVMRDFGQGTVDELIGQYSLERIGKSNPARTLRALLRSSRN